MPTTDSNEELLLARLDLILTSNMPIHPEHHIDKRNIINAFKPFLASHIQTIGNEVIGPDMAVDLHTAQKFGMSATDIMKARGINKFKEEQRIRLAHYLGGNK